MHQPNSENAGPSEGPLPKFPLNENSPTCSRFKEFVPLLVTLFTSVITI